MSLSRFPRLLVTASLVLTVGATGLVATSLPSTASDEHGHADESTASDEHGHSADDGHGHFGAGGKSMAGGYWDAPRVPQTRTTTVDPWPAAATVVERLQAHGITPILTEGYDDPVYERNARLDGRGTTPRAVMMHDTGTSVPVPKLKNTHSLNWILNGVKNSNGKTVRACHFYVARDGSVYFIYARRTWHAGAGDPMFGIASNMMNGYSYGIEIESQGSGVQDLTEAQFVASKKVAAAALEASQLPIDRLIDHKLYAGRVQGKVDTAYDLNLWKSLVGQEMGVPFTPPVVSPNPRDVSLTKLRVGESGAYVSRYQKALRTYAAGRGIKVRAINPSGVTGSYGSETKRLTKVTHKNLAAKSANWRTYLNTLPEKGVPGAKLIRKIGLNPIS